MFLKFDPYRVWCAIYYSKLINWILFKIIVQHVRIVKGRGTCGSGERNVKIWIEFRKSPSFSLTSPLSQEREREVKSPCFYYVWWALVYSNYTVAILFSLIPNLFKFKKKIKKSINVTFICSKRNILYCRQQNVYFKEAASLTSEQEDFVPIVDWRNALILEWEKRWYLVCNY